MKVYIDSREQDKIQQLFDFWKKFKNKYNYIEKIETRTLATSDICTSDGLVGFERKSSSDFIGSICGGGLKKQLHELKQNFKFSFLFIEDYNGILDCIEDNPQVHPNVIFGAIASACAHSKVPVTFVGDFYTKLVFETIEKFYDGKDNQYESKEYNPVRRTATKKDYQKNIIMGLPNIGIIEGVKLLQQYDNSIYKFVRGAVENNKELTKIERIGPIKAKKIKEVLE